MDANMNTAYRRRQYERGNFVDESDEYWVNDMDVTACLACKKIFNALNLRKHHCRLCGNIFCKDDAPKIVHPDLKNGAGVRLCSRCCAAAGVPMPRARGLSVHRPGIDYEQVIRTDAKGVEIKRYSIIEKLGSGAFGQVSRVCEPGKEKIALNRYDVVEQWALKQIEIPQHSTAEISGMVKTEIVALSKMNHPNVTTLKGYFPLYRPNSNNVIDAYCILMEYHAGSSLQKALEKVQATRAGRMPLQMAMHIFVQLMNALEYTHKLQIAHCDVKPGNVVIVVEEKVSIVKLVDFGISVKGMEFNDRGAGTLAYMPPEAFTKTVTYAQDLWGLALILYELIEGEILWNDVAHKCGLYGNEYKNIDLYREKALKTLSLMDHDPTGVFREMITTLMGFTPNSNEVVDVNQQSALSTIRQSPIFKGWETALELKDNENKIMTAEAAYAMDANYHFTKAYIAIIWDHTCSAPFRVRVCEQLLYIVGDSEYRAKRMAHDMVGFGLVHAALDGVGSINNTKDTINEAALDALPPEWKSLGERIMIQAARSLKKHPGDLAMSIVVQLLQNRYHGISFRVCQIVLSKPNVIQELLELCISKHRALRVGADLMLSLLVRHNLFRNTAKKLLNGYMIERLARQQSRNPEFTFLFGELPVVGSPTVLNGYLQRILKFPADKLHGMMYDYIRARSFLVIPNASLRRLLAIGIFRIYDGERMQDPRIFRTFFRAFLPLAFPQAELAHILQYCSLKSICTAEVGGTLYLRQPMVKCLTCADTPRVCMPCWIACHAACEGRVTESRSSYSGACVCRNTIEMHRCQCRDTDARDVPFLANEYDATTAAIEPEPYSTWMPGPEVEPSTVHNVFHPGLTYDAEQNCVYVCDHHDKLGSTAVDRTLVPFQMTGVDLKLDFKASESVAFYFEFELQDFTPRMIRPGVTQTAISIGLAPFRPGALRHIGWAQHEFGYHSDTGGYYTHAEELKSNTTSGQRHVYGMGDTVGCGVTTHGQVFFTLNGLFLGVVTSHRYAERQRVYASLCVENATLGIHANFGESPFMFKFTADSKLNIASWRAALWEHVNVDVLRLVLERIQNRRGSRVATPLENSGWASVTGNTATINHNVISRAGLSSNDTAIGKTVFHNDNKAHSWCYKISYKNIRYIAVGLVPAKYVPKAGHYAGSGGFGEGWAFDLGDGTILSHTLGDEDSKQRGIGKYSKFPVVFPRTTEEKTVYVTAVLGRKGNGDGKLEFFVDGVSLGVAFRNVVGPVRPAVFLYKSDAADSIERVTLMGSETEDISRSFAEYLAYQLYQTRNSDPVLGASILWALHRIAEEDGTASLSAALYAAVHELLLQHNMNLPRSSMACNVIEYCTFL